MIVSGGQARAQVTVDLIGKDAPEPTEEQPVQAPYWEAHVRGAPGGLGKKDFELKQIDRNPPILVKAEDVKMYPQSNTKMALVVLVQGTGHWMGNETYYEGDDAPQEGAFTAIGPALDELAKAGPKGSRAAVLVYGNGKTEPRLKMDDISKLNGGVMGTQQDYDKILDFPLLVGLKDAIGIFDNHAGYRKVLVVIGDGTGERDDIGGDLSARIDDLTSRKVETYSVHYESVATGEQTGYQNMARLGYTDHQKASSRDNFATFAKSFVDAINAVYYVTLPGCVPNTPPTTETCMHDGQLHEFALILQGDGDNAVEIETQTKPFEPPKPPEETSLWWLWLILGILGALILILIIVKIATRKKPEPVIMEMPAPAPAPEPFKPKTVMLGIGGSNEGVPIVGWVVPLNGPNQYQTFKLLDGITKIGSGPDANVVIQDHFMSTVHCEIIASPGGFRLKDGGSTNGTQVNEQPVNEHDLVDNDYLSMGKTNFKFKSII